MINNYWID